MVATIALVVTLVVVVIQWRRGMKVSWGGAAMFVAFTTVGEWVVDAPEPRALVFKAGVIVVCIIVVAFDARRPAGAA